MEKDRRKELQENYKQLKTYMGVIQIKNEVNGKIFIASYPNLKNKWLNLKSQLEMGRFANLQLQKDWAEYGETSFTYDVLEEQDTEDISDIRWEAKQLLKKWLDQLQPFEEKGYNKKPIE